MGRVERQFQGIVLQIIHEIISENPDLPFDALPLQEEGWNDVLVRDKEKLRGVAAIELKDPEAPDGGTPYHHSLVEEAERHAANQGARYFITWNIQDAILWDRTKPEVPLFESDIASFPVLAPKEALYFKKSKFAYEPSKERIKKALIAILSTISGLLIGKFPPLRELDERFIDRIRALIGGFLYPVAYDVEKSYQENNNLRRKIIDWVVKEQYWTWEGTEDILSEEIERLTRLALLFLLNKLIFYKAMQASGTWTTLPMLVIPDSIRDREKAEKYIWKEYFNLVVREIDYETIFGEKITILDELPFLSKSIIGFLKEFLTQASFYDFSHLPLDIVGRIFERLIREEERHKMGQYFTRPDVVDLINSFCIKFGDAIILDPGTGSGTFLINAYYRKKNLTEKSHWEILNDLWGVDIAPYPVHLATLNLAIRDLRLKRNYPKILKTDVFDVRPERTYHKIRTPDGAESETIVPKVDAVVGNPPYTRQEEMEEIFEGTKEKAWNLVKAEWNYQISKRSGIHSYFFYHAAKFLKDGGRLGFITSDSWLDVDYGKYLQKFFLEHFKIVSIIDSKVERWFPDALVNTAITIVELCDDEEERNKNIVKFVYLKKPLSEILYKLTSDNFSEIIEKTKKTKEPQETDDWRIFTIEQEELWKEALDEEGNFIGSKWTKFLKAPKVYWKILEQGKDKLCRLSSLADVRFGIKTGANEFFYVKDITDNYTSKELQLNFGFKKNSGFRLIMAGDGSIHKIEKKFLRPIITSPKEIRSLTVKADDLHYKMVLINKEKRELKGTKALEFINWGEGKGRAFHKRTTCASRPRWYDLGDKKPWPLLFPMIHASRHVIAQNTLKAQVDHNLFEIKPKLKKFSTSILATLISSVGALFKEFESRSYGGGSGPIKTEGIDIVRQFVIAPEKVNKIWMRKISAQLNKMAKRDFLEIFEELNKPDRQDIDDLILKCLGFSVSNERKQVLKELYEALTDIIKSRGEKARSVEKETKKRRITNILILTDQITIELREKIANPEPNFTTLNFTKEIIKQRTPNQKLREQLMEAVWTELFGEAAPMPGQQTKLFD